MKYKKLLLSVGIASLLSACGGSSNNDAPTPDPTSTTYTYEVSVTNLTNAQPISPVAVVLHDEGQLWSLGESASVALETMAEGGMNADLLASSFTLASGSSANPIGPGATATISVDIESFPQFISIAGMLVNTNDAFTGVNAKDISALALNESVKVRTNTYDSGTEKNTEADGTMPGPADGGEGFNAERDDVINVVTMHPGVVSQDDGLIGSVLTEAHRFDNPTLSVTITRTK